MIFNSCYFGGSGVCVSACLSVYVSVCVFPSFGFANVRLFISCVFNLLGLDLFFFSSAFCRAGFRDKYCLNLTTS